MAEIPPHRTGGDAHHASDHNLIADALTEHEQRITAASDTFTNLWRTTGANVANLTGPNTGWAQVNLPSGDRTAAADTMAVYAGTQRTFALTGLGETRLTAPATGRIPLVASAMTGQTADLTRWNDASGTAIAGITANGSAYGKNVGVNPWQPLTVNTGYRAHATTSGGFGYMPEYQIVGPDVRLHGTLSKTNGGVLVYQDVLCTLPGPLTPAQTQFFLGATGTASGSMWSVRVDVNNDGTVRVRFNADAYGSGVPTWVALDGIRWEVPVSGGTVTIPVTPTFTYLNWVTTTSVRADWTASAGATSYRLYMTGDATNVFATSDTTYTVTGLTSGGTYHFFVSAVNSAGESPLSA